MGYSEEYIHAFCKTAADMGYDPELLAAMAGRGTLEKRAAKVPVGSGSAIGDFVGKWVSRLLGSPAIRKKPLAQIGKLQGQLKPLKDAYATMSIIRGASPAAMRAAGNRIASLERRIERLQKSIAPETGKVYATRLATGIGGLGAYGIYANTRKETDKGSLF